MEGLFPITRFSPFFLSPGLKKKSSKTGIGNSPMDTETRKQSPALVNQSLRIFMILTLQIPNLILHCII